MSNLPEILEVMGETEEICGFCRVILRAAIPRLKNFVTNATELVRKINNNIIGIDPSQCTGLQQVHAAQALQH